MNINTLVLLSLFLMVSCQNASKETPLPDKEELYALAETDLKTFAEVLTQDAQNDLQGVKQLVGWLAENFDWKATDYKKRTVKEIVIRRGGNCNELAMVTKAALEELGLPMRKMREINIHIESDRRRQTAMEKVANGGSRMSVFGKRHNDHVWLEIFDRATEEWFPADPSIGVVGEKEWLSSRIGFGERFTLDPSSNDMIAPFAIFAENKDKKALESRTRIYVVDGFNDLYDNQLESLPSWGAWQDLVAQLSEKARGAFEGKINLHESESDIDQLAAIYEQLKEEYLKRNDTSQQR